MKDLTPGFGPDPGFCDPGFWTPGFVKMVIFMPHVTKRPLEHILRSSYVAIAVTMLVVSCLHGCGKSNDAEVSGPSYCKDYSEPVLKELAQKGDLESVRYLRDLHMDCDVGMKHQGEALRWAKIAAEMGNAEDKRIDDEFRAALKEAGSRGTASGAR